MRYFPVRPLPVRHLAVRCLAVLALVLLALVPITWMVAIHDRLTPGATLQAKLQALVRPIGLLLTKAGTPQPTVPRPTAVALPQAASSNPSRRVSPILDEDATDEALAAAPSASEATIFAGPTAAANPFASYHPLLDRQLSSADKAADLAPDLADAIVRIEGIYDPTRIGALGPALRMQIRPGTASMTNVFGDRWLRADIDPNVHYKVHTSAEVWLHPLPRGCEGFTRFRPYDGVLTLDAMGAGDCARIAREKKGDVYAVVYQPVVGVPMSVPVFAAPYAGGRFTLPQLRAIQDARRDAAQQRLWFKRGPAMPVLFKADPITGRPRRIPSPIPPR